jgi:hypothetical protein
MIRTGHSNLPAVRRGHRIQHRRIVRPNLRCKYGDQHEVDKYYAIGSHWHLRSRMLREHASYYRLTASGRRPLFGKSF